jgi:hypothetical protein
MNLNQIINMVLRVFVRKGVNWGINKGTRMVASRSKPGTGPAVDHGQSAQARELAKRARKAAAITRRIGR